MEKQDLRRRREDVREDDEGDDQQGRASDDDDGEDHDSESAADRHHHRGSGEDYDDGDGDEEAADAAPSPPRKEGEGGSSDEGGSSEEDGSSGDEDDAEREGGGAAAASGDGANEQPRCGRGDGEPDKKKRERKAAKAHRLSLAKTTDFNEKLGRRGVVYVARVPPRMTPTKVRSLLGEHGTITRVYLSEEDPSARRRRRKQTGGGGGRSKRYTEGWVEFEDKALARHVAANLNATPVTNRKRSPHHGDLWALRYLPKFKWGHLTEKVAYERRVREQRLRLETMQARRETAAYRELVEAGKKLDRIEERRKRRREAGGPAAAGAAAASNDEEPGHRDPKRPARGRPRQVPVAADGGGGSSAAPRKPLLGALV
jgi:ESF2/ABP1 family protein